MGTARDYTKNLKPSIDRKRSALKPKLSTCPSWGAHGYTKALETQRESGYSYYTLISAYLHIYMCGNSHEEMDLMHPKAV